MATDFKQTYSIEAPVERVWAELTTSGTPRGWLYDTIATSDWQPGSRYEMRTEDGFLMIDGEVLESDAPNRLHLGFGCHWDAEVDAEEPGTLSYDLRSIGDATELTVTSADLGPATRASAEESNDEIYAGLKAQLES